MRKRKTIRRRRRWADSDIGDFRRLDPMMMTRETQRLYFAKKGGGDRP